MAAFASLFFDLAGGEVALDAGAVTVEMAADEHRLRRRRHAVEAHPAELVPATGIVEDAVPVAAGEADEPLGAHDIGWEAFQHPLESVLAERALGAPHEAREAVGVEMVRRAARPIAKRRDPGGEEHVAVDRAAHGPEALRARVQARDPALDRD